MAVTLQEVARKAQVSKSAVSAVLAGSDGRSGTRVGESTRARIEAAARDLGYRPNMLAKGLAGGRTRTIGIAWSLGRPSAGAFVQDLSIRLWRQGYVTILTNGLSDQNVSDKVLSDFAMRGMEGIIFHAAHGLLDNASIVHRLKQFKAAVAVVDQYQQSPVDLVVQDTPHGVGQLMEYWLTTGRRRIGFVGHAASNQEKIGPLFEKAREAGLSGPVVVDLEQVVPMGDNFDAYQRGLERKFGHWHGDFACDSLFCASDIGAASAINWLRRRGLRVPEDVAVAGVENSDVARVTFPLLASLDRHGLELSETIEQTIMQRLERPQEAIRTKLVPSTFVWRESAGRCPPSPAAAGKERSCRASEAPMI